MTPEALTRLFLLLGSLSLLLNASTVSYIQGGVTFVDVFSESKLVAAFYGIFICGILLILTLVSCGLHARRSKGKTWAERSPLVWISEQDDGVQDRKAWETKGYLIIILAIFVLAPVYGVGHMTKTVLYDGWVHQKDVVRFDPSQYPPVNVRDALPLLGSEWNSSTIQIDKEGAALRLGYRDRQQKTVDWLPVLTPLGLAFILTGILYAFFWCLLGVLLSS